MEVNEKSFYIPTGLQGSTHLFLIGCGGGMSAGGVKPDTSHEVKGHHSCRLLILLFKEKNVVNVKK